MQGIVELFHKTLSLRLAGFFSTSILARGTFSFARKSHSRPSVLLTLCLRKDMIHTLAPTEESFLCYHQPDFPSTCYNGLLPAPKALLLVTNSLITTFVLKGLKLFRRQEFSILALLAITILCSSVCLR